MAEYGVLSTGFVRKPLATVLAEFEAAAITQFGPDVIQTAQSPLGQLNGMMADLTAVLWEFAEDVYQSYDPDQAEGARLEILGRLRLVGRQVAEADTDYRKAITNEGRARIDLQDLARAVAGLDGVTYSQVFLNESGELDEFEVASGTIVIAVLGGDDEEIAQVSRQYIVPGISTFGNNPVSTTIDGYCRTVNLLRPLLIPMLLDITVRLFNDRLGCPPPSATDIKQTVINNINLVNGDDLTYFKVRQAIESAFSTVEVVSITAQRKDLETGEEDQGGVIGFIEMATLALEDITVNVI